MKKLATVGLGLLVFVAPAIAENLPAPLAPEGMTATVFAQPPTVNYPVCIAASVDGAVFVGVDKQGSLGKKEGDGKVVRCIDTDGDGVADKFTTFAVMDHPRGLVYDHNTLWVLHPPTVTMYTDTNGDGVADESKVLITGISTDMVNKRGADHTTNGIRLGIDGWIYIAMGDFGCVDATGTDGRKLTVHGGGVVRFRPDGTQLELYAFGTRNILDVCIDPYMNAFVRDNTNDGGGWNVRVAHIIQSANLGYPRLFTHFGSEILPPLADYGGGSGCGGLYLHEPGFPKPYDDILLTCDWGRSWVYSHKLPADGATFDPQQDEFIHIERPTDIDVDGSSHLYVTSWRGGQFAYKGEDIGFVAQYKPTGYTAPPVIDYEKADVNTLVAALADRSAVRRMAAQRAILRRKADSTLSDRLVALASDNNAPLYGRAAAIFTLKQAFGSASTSLLVKLADDDAVREFALREMTDRMDELAGVPASLYEKALHDSNPRVRVAAMIGIGRLGDANAAGDLLAMAHMKSLAVSTDEPETRSVEGEKVSKVEPVEMSIDVTGGKVLYLMVGDGGDGNGMDHASWIDPHFESPAGLVKCTSLKWINAGAGWGSVGNNKDCEGKPLKVGGKVVEGIGTHAPSIIAFNIPKGATKFVTQTSPDDGSQGKGSIQFSLYVDKLPAGESSDDYVNKANPAIVEPHMAIQTLAKLDSTAACVAALDGPNSDAAIWALKYKHDKAAVDGLIAHLLASNLALKRAVLTDLVRLYYDEAPYTNGDWWGTRPDTTGPYYVRAKWDESDRIEQAIRDEAAKLDPSMLKFLQGQLAKHRVVFAGLSSMEVATADTGKKNNKKKMKDEPKVDLSKVLAATGGANTVGAIGFDKAKAEALKFEGDSNLGKTLFTQQGCIACHTTADGQTPKGPHLAAIGKRYSREELLSSILTPSAVIAQGFDTHVITLKDNTVQTGFVVNEGADTIELRNIAGQSATVKKSDIASRTVLEQSMMPQGLVNALTPEQLASLLAYLESL
ncbi:MAG: c-type cytochrome [Planctomycetes bacterium]|nr:c-type cytochrome [Planctomycetota bacterium]